MKKLHEFTNREVRDLIVSLSAELKILMDDDMKTMLKEYADAQKGRKTEISVIDIIQRIVDSALIKNEDAFWRALAAITQSTSEEVQNMNNADTMEAVAGFFSIDRYKKLFLSAITPDTKK